MDTTTLYNQVDRLAVIICHWGNHQCQSNGTIAKYNATNKQVSEGYV